MNTLSGSRIVVIDEDMSTENQWNLLFTHCLSCGYGTLPSLTGSGEPWIDIEALEKITGVSAKTIRNKVSTGKVKRHPAFNSFVLLSELESSIEDEKT